MSKKSIFITLGVLLALFILYKTIFSKEDNSKHIETASVKEMTIIETVSATGKIQPETEIKIMPEVSGEIIALPVKEGQVVKKGDLLVKINPDLYTSGLNRTVAGLSQTKAGLSQADAQFNEAKSNYDRNKTLFDKGIISKSDWDKAISAFEVAKASKQSAYYNVQSASASVNEAQDNLGRTTIYAPADGTISTLAVELGERVLGQQQMTGTEMMRVANLNSMEVEVDVNENDIVKINIGDSARVEVDAYLKKKFKGIVTSISNSASTTQTADQVTNFKVKIRILKESYADLLEGKPESYSPFRPGMTATVDIETKRRANVLAIPISAVVVKSDTLPMKKMEGPEGENQPQTPKSDKKLECVFVKSGNKARIRIIKTGIQDDTNIEILSGLKSGEVIISGPYNLITKELNSGDVVVNENESGNSAKK
ncbi:efflux RND transporter periplasmic adaptor subunit [Flavobacterium pallidum]|uniref:Efflux RND transporter periplasmic adaptor subunit n=1 Tax=Flavobacterium pallidum TaxID=2172098 RepID=A0A2S1SGB6_9FLAO|nr:efflux RND transporter periplasmic adaptor subunit [Flavobacterium pallidum]AWI25411.1 efflux RND transporter periplasmic adaptor subunit [Flavobacterium pallidum]